MRKNRAHAYITIAIESIDNVSGSESLTPIGPKSSSQLQWIRNVLVQMLDDVENGRAPVDIPGVGRVIVDSWPLNDVLGETILLAEHAYKDFWKETRKHCKNL